MPDSGAIFFLKLVRSRHPLYRQSGARFSPRCIVRMIFNPWTYMGTYRNAFRPLSDTAAVALLGPYLPRP